MCGIVGMVSAKGVQPRLLQQAASLLRHRGPDSEGLYSNPSQTAALAHKRLCIIDASEGGAQPMHWGERYTIVYNGELYNYLELKSWLAAKGFSFHSASDTEVVLAAYVALGQSCLEHFDGAFAFAIWDEEEGVLFAARDRFGEKPFYYSIVDGALLFASEMRSLWELGLSKELNPAMVYNFLTIGYTTNPSDPAETFYANISKLPAAGSLRFDVKTGTCTVERWWQVFLEPPVSITEDEAIEQLVFRLQDSVSKRLRSDVAIGTSLSGGLDSSAIVALCEQLAPAQYTHQCFTASFPGFAKDETDHAKEVAKKFGLNHHIIGIEDREVPALMDAVMYHQEEPILSGSPLVQFQLYKAARAEGVTVLLDGQGADEMLGGYHHYYKWYWMELFRQRRLGKTGELAKARALGVQTPFGWKEKLAALAPQLAQGIVEGRKAKTANQHAGLHADFAFNHKADLYYTMPPEPGLNGALYFNSFMHGLEDLLRLADRNSMAHSVEVRLPFLQHQLAEWLFTLPPSLKIRDGWTKWLLRKSMDKVLPSSITWRKDKVGFEPPQRSWMENKEVAQSIKSAKELLVKEGILDPSVLNKKIQPHEAHAAENIDWKYWSLSYLYGKVRS